MCSSAEKIEENAIYTFGTPEQCVKSASYMTSYSKFIGERSEVMANE